MSNEPSQSRLTPTSEAMSRLEQAKMTLPKDLQIPGVLALFTLSLAEDLSPSATWDQIASHPPSGDITSTATLPSEKWLTGRIFAKGTGVIAGMPVVRAIYALVSPEITFTVHVTEGEGVLPGKLLAEISGPGTALLSGERTALNFLGRLSGIASLTQKFVEEVSGTEAIILDTRKTAPGLRHLDKYAVRMGGGQNHRLGLFDMALIKDNHIDGAGGVGEAIELVRNKYGSRYPIEIEVKDLQELQIALSLPIDRIMLDNMDLETMRKAVAQTNGRVPLEASGNVSLKTVRAIAETGVNFISVGALTHSAPVLDISMRLG